MKNEINTKKTILNLFVNGLQMVCKWFANYLVLFRKLIYHIDFKLLFYEKTTCCNTFWLLAAS
jgi:hypothetical protein